jgi:hypothetical protein
MSPRQSGGDGVGFGKRGMLSRQAVSLIQAGVHVRRSSSNRTRGLFGWAVAVKKVAVGCELWKKLL